MLSVIEMVDVDKSGQIDYEEFIASTVNLHKLEREHILLDAFKHFDTDSSGSLSTDEIREGLVKFGVTDAEISVLPCSNPSPTLVCGLLELEACELYCMAHTKNLQDQDF